MKLERVREPQSQDLEEIESITGLKLSESYREIYLKYSGMKAQNWGPEISVKYMDESEGKENIQEFLTHEDIRKQWEFVGYLKEHAEHFELGSDFVEPEYLVPIANTYDSVLYISVFGEHKNKVYFADNGDFGILLIADNVQQFVEMFDRE